MDRSVALIIINGYYMKFLMLIPLLFGMALTGCDNTVLSGVGGIPILSFSGSVAGHAKNVQIQAIGIDSNGLLNRDEEGKLLGDVYVTDSEGNFEGMALGVYTSSYLLLAKYSVASTQITCSIPENNGNCVDGDGKVFTFGQVFTVPASQLRCDIADSLGGCRSAAGETVAFNDTYSITESFEMMAVVNQIEDNDVFTITPVTHLAAKLALTEFVSDGIDCDDTACDTSAFINGRVTSQSIHEANSRVQQLFSLSTAFHVQTPFWTPLSNPSTADSIQKIERAKHGLLVATWPLLSMQRGESLLATLTWWQNSFLNNAGQLLGEDSRIDDTKELDLKSLYAAALDISGTQTDETVTVAASVFDAILKDLSFADLLDTATAFRGTDFPVAEGEQLLDEKVTLARDLVAKVQLWVADLEQKEYASFFDESGSTVMADNFNLMETRWDLFQKQLAPNVQGLFRPMTEFVHYALTCSVTVADCDTAYEYSDTVTLDSTGEQTLFTLSVNQANDLFPKLLMSGSFQETSSAGVTSTTFVFKETLVVETALGKSQLIVSDSSTPSVLFALSTDLTAGTLPQISVIDLNLPELKVQAKDTTDGYQELVYLGENITLTMVGVNDALFPSKPRHFNIHEMNLPGKIQYGSGDNADSIEFAITLISKNAFSFYTGADDELFQNLDFTLDTDAFKQFSQFGAVDYSSSKLAGFLQPSSDIEDKKITGETVEYVEEFSYANLDADLQGILGLTQAQFDFGGLGGLAYPGGKTAWVVWSESELDSGAGLKEGEMARQCLQVSGKWGCFDPQTVSSLGCGETYGVTQSTVRAVSEYFQANECIQNVNIDGAGIYAIGYGTAAITIETPYSLSFVKAVTLGFDSLNVRVLSRFKGDDNQAQPVAFLNVLGQALDEENISVSVSLTHNYQGIAGLDGLSFTDLAPLGDHTLWFAMGQQGGTSSDELTYYLQDGDIALTMKAFDKALDNDQPVGLIRYAGSLVATISREGGVYVIRYINDTWQVL